MGVSKEQVLEALSVIQDPDLHKDIVTLGFIKKLEIVGGKVSFAIELTTPACPVKEKFRKQAHEVVSALAGVDSVEVEMTANVRARAPQQGAILPNVKNIIAIASGKGGVGKSTMTANIACALAKSGARVGLLDADIYGPSIPKMIGANNPELKITEENRITPFEAHGLKVMSLGFMVTDETPVIWRGPMVHNILSQFLRQVDWGDLDYLVIDLPPGTGDAQLTLTQSVPLSGAVIVTTPQEVSIQIASKGLRMFSQVNVPVLGFIENMSHFICPHCAESTAIFRHGGTRKASEIHGVPFLGEVPLDAQITLDGDNGVPTVISHPDSAASKAVMEITGKIAAALSTQHMQETEQPGANLNLLWKASGQ